MLLQISHESTYHYDEPMPFGLQQIRLTPVSQAGQEVLHWQTSVEGATKEVEFTDHHHNFVELFSFIEGDTTVHIRSSGEVDTSDTGGVLPGSAELCPVWLFQRNTELTHAGPLVGELTERFAKHSGSAVDQMHELSHQIREVVDYRSGDTHASSTAEQALALGAGVCQDHAHVFISAARSLGHPARYVSGYLMMDDRTHQEASHAWAEVLIEDLGWVGFDVSNGISPDERYVRIATGLDYREAAPISGIRFGAGEERLHVSLQVQQ